MKKMAQEKKANLKAADKAADKDKDKGKGKPAATTKDDEQIPSFFVLALKRSEAKETARVLSEVFGKGRLSVGVDERTNSLVIRATEKDLLVIKRLIDQLDTDMDTPQKDVPNPKPAKKKSK